MHTCIDDGWLVGGQHLLPEWPSARKWSRQNHGPGCNNLVCTACSRKVLSSLVSPPVDHAPLRHYQRLAAGFPTYDPGAGNWRLYACHCTQHVESGSASAPELDPNWGTTTPWRCAGHPVLQPPCEALGVMLGDGWWDQAVETLALDASLERQGSIGTALGVVWAALDGTSRDAYAEAMLRTLRHPDPEIRLRVLQAFVLLDVAPELVRRLAQLAIAEPQWTTVTGPIARPLDNPDWWAARACAAISPPGGANVDDRHHSLVLLRRVVLRPPGGDYLASTLAMLDPVWTAEHIVEVAAVDQAQGAAALYCLRNLPELHAAAHARLGP